jgi:hypothetical protein
MYTFALGSRSRHRSAGSRHPALLEILRLRIEQDEESGWPNRCTLGLNEAEIEAEAVAYLLASREPASLRAPQPIYAKCERVAKLASLPLEHSARSPVLDVGVVALIPNDRLEFGQQCQSSRVQFPPSHSEIPPISVRMAPWVKAVAPNGLKKEMKALLRWRKPLVRLPIVAIEGAYAMWQRPFV